MIAVVRELEHCQSNRNMNDDGKRRDGAALSLVRLNCRTTEVKADENAWMALWATHIVVC